MDLSVGSTVCGRKVIHHSADDGLGSFFWGNSAGILYSINSENPASTSECLGSQRDTTNAIEL